MRKPRPYHDFWKLTQVIFAVISLASVCSSENSEIETIHSCDELYNCGTAQSLFSLGQQYFYTYQLESIVTIEKYFGAYGLQDVSRSISKNGTLLIIPLSSCEFLATSSSSESSSFLKVAVENGKVQRTCSSSSDPTDPETNTLRALVSLTQGNFASSTDLKVYPETVNNQMILESDSEGTCLTKYVQCPSKPNNFIKYKLMDTCSRRPGSTDIFHNIQLKTANFQSLIDVNSQSAKCESPESDLEAVEGLTVCAIKKNENGLISSSECVESQSSVGYDLANINLEKVIQNGTPPGGLSFYMVGILQHSDNAILPWNNEASNMPTVSSVVSRLLSLSPGPNRKEMNTSDLQTALNEVKQFLNFSPDKETILECLDTLGSSKHAIAILLEMAADELHRESLLEFLEAALSRDLNLSADDLNSVITRAAVSLHNLKFISKRTLEFNKFMVDYVNLEKSIIDTNRHYMMITFGDNLNIFCDRMQSITGENFCLKNDLIQEWINSLIISKVQNSNNSTENIAMLEAFAKFQRYSKVSCKNIIEKTTSSSQKLWAVLNCYRYDVCNKEGKLLHRTLMDEDDSVTSNIRIASYLAIMECVQEEDLTVIRRIVQSQNNELVDFIKAHISNRISKGVMDQRNIFGDEATLSNNNAEHSINSSKITRASNTLLSLSPLTSQIWLLETNILYFDELAMIPEVITGRFSINEVLEYRQHIAQVENLIYFEVFVDDARNAEDSMNFHLTIVFRMMDTTIFTTGMEISRTALLQHLQMFRQQVQNNFPNNQIISVLRRKLTEMIASTVNVDVLGTLSNTNRDGLQHSISGMAQNALWKLDAFGRFAFKKDDCSGLAEQDGTESNCKLELVPDFGIINEIFISTGSPGLERGFMIRSDISGALPISLFLGKSVEEDIIKLTTPSSVLHLVQGNDHVVYKMDAENHQISLEEIMMSMKLGPGTPPPDRDTDITIRTNDTIRSTIISFIHPSYESTVEIGVNSMFTMQGQFICSPNSAHPKTYSFEVSASNSDDNKKLLAKLTRGEDEYILDGYFIRKIAPLDDSDRPIWLRCSGQRGLLCSWPLCIFCDAEYFIGATASTPKFKNIKLIEGSITQEFPRKRIDIVLRTSGIPVVRNAEFKASLTRGNDTNIFQGSRLRDGLNGKLAQLFPSPTRDEGDGDARPASEATALSSHITGYSGNVEITSEVLGSAALSAIYVIVAEKTTIFGGGLFHSRPAGPEEKHTLFATIHHPGNFSQDFVSKVSLRSTLLPIVNTDAAFQSQHINSTVVKRVVVLKPINLIRGEIRVEVVDKSGEGSSNFLQFFQSRWLDISFDQTYKVYLPKHLNYHVFKGKLVAKRANGILEEAGAEALIGFDHAFEFKYEQLKEDQGTAYKLLTSIITGGNTYGLHHRIEPVVESSENDNSLITLEDDELALEKFKYRGTYIFRELSFKALGIFLERKGLEILPFSKFGIQLTSVDGNEEGTRIIGTEIINEDIHNMEVSIRKGDSNIFEFKNEVNPSSQVPIKAAIAVKDYADVKIHDTSKYTNSRNLQVKAKWIPSKRVITGKVSFPTSLEESLYLDIDVSVANEGDRENPLYKLTSSSSVEFGSNSSVTTENTFHAQKSKWEFGLDSFHLTETEIGYNEIEESYNYKRLKNMSFSAHYSTPNLGKYAVKLECNDYVKNQDNAQKIYVKLERPQVTPLLLHLEKSEENHMDRHISDDYKSYNVTRNSHDRFIASFCHKDNFLYLFPKLDRDISIEVEREEHNEHQKEEERWTFSGSGKTTCNSRGFYIPYMSCNQKKTSYKFNSESSKIQGANKFGPWIASFSAIESSLDHTDEVDMKLLATYASVRPTSVGLADVYMYQYWNLVEGNLLSTVEDGQLLRHNYNIDYDIRRKDASGQLYLGINGTYVFTKMYESVNYFEFSDQLRWSDKDGGKFHIWSNLLNHTSDSNLTSASATFASQYVSLGSDDEVGTDGSKSNITWMELRSAFNSNGFGTIPTLILEPTSIFAIDEGDIEADFLVKTEFSPLRAFRMLFSHEQKKHENDEDEPVKYGTLTKVNGILNDAEVSGMNSMTLAVGKLIGLGESFIGRYRSQSGIYEYVTINAFAVVPAQLCENGQENVLHFDVSSSWTDSNDDDTDLRLVNDVVYKWPLTEGPIFRFAYFENSTDLDTERNGSFFIYRSLPNTQRTGVVSLPDSIISEGLDELSFTQMSLQSISQQIVDDYYNITNLGESESDDSSGTWHDYNVEIKGNSLLRNSTRSYNMNAKWLGFQEKYYYCRSSLEVCNDMDETRVDTSNYCNLIFLPLKQVTALF